MSSPSKKRRAARAWMHEERHRTDLERAAAAARARREARAEADEEWTRRLTRIVPRTLDHFDQPIYPQGPVQQPYLKIDLLEAPSRVMPYGTSSSLSSYRIDSVLLEAVPNALVLPNGQKVIWFGWKVRG